MRQCKRENCDFEGKPEDFPLGATVNGKKYYRHVCADCYNNQKQKQRRERFEEFLEFKKTLQCEQCGVNDHRVLEFHHKENSEKTENVSRMATNGWSMERIMEEVEKCKVLCANCHRIEHYGEDQ